MSATDDFEARAAEVLRLLRAGVSPADLTFHLTDARTLARLRRLALLRRADRAGLALALGPDSDADLDQTLLALLDAGDLIRPDPAQDVYLIPPSVREAHLPRWDVRPGVAAPSGANVAEFLARHAALAEHFGARGPDWSQEVLHHRLAVDPAAGLELLDVLLLGWLPRADPDGDGAIAPEVPDGLAVARALDLLDVAAAQLPFLPEALKPRYNAARGLVESWSWWSDAWFRTRRYVPRPRLQPALVAQRTRLLEVTARGGSGKTMLLRWFITHHCLPRRRLVAHLDFDHYIGRPWQPWQLLLDCAEQLDRQFPQAPFHSLRLSGRDLASAPTAPAANDFAANLPQVFGGVLKSQGEAPVTLILDTFEEAMLTRPTEAVGLVALLANCARVASRLRLVLCGRYPLSHLGLADELAARDPAAHGFYVEQVERLRLPLFDGDEAAAYLARRDLRLDDATLARVLEMATGIGVGGPEPDDAPDRASEKPPVPEVSPFHLGLIADLLHDRQARGEAPDALLAELHQVPVIYLIERVIRRIEDVGVRWLLRYGVVPRRLTRPFFADVILPYLQRVHRAGRPADGDPVERALPAGLGERSLYFTDSAILHGDPTAIWDRLKAFARPDAWVWTDGDALIFHPCVRDPMLDLLASDPALAAIHADAAGWFARALDAAGTADERAALAPELAYHAARSGPQGFGPGLDDLLARLYRYDATLDFATAFALADALARDMGARLETRRFAVGALAMLLALDLHDVAPDRPGRERWLGAAARTLRELRPLLPAADAEWFDALIQVREPDADRDQIARACTRLDGALAGDARVAATVLAADRRARALAIGRERLGDARCVADFTALLDARPPGHGGKLPLTAFLFASLGRALACFGDAGPAWASLAQAFVSAAEPPPWVADGAPPMSDATRLMTLSAIGLLDRLGHYDAAGALAAAPEGTPGQAIAAVPALALARVRAGLRDHPAARLAALYETAAAPPTTPANAAQVALTAHWCHALLGDLPAALADLSEAAALFSQDDDATGAADCALLEAHLWGRHHGNPARALDALARYERTLAASGRDPTAGLRAELLRRLELRLAPAWFARGPRTDPGTDAGADWASHADLRAAAARQAELPCVAERAGAVVALLALRLADAPAGADKVSDQTLVGMLAGTLALRPDTVARACYPWLLRERRTPLVVAADLAGRLAALLDLRDPPPPVFGQPPGDSDLAWARLAHAHLLRLIGRRDLARGQVERAAAWFEAGRSLTGLREVWHLQAFHGWAVPTAERLAAFADAPVTLRTIVAIEQAEHALRTGAPGRAADWLALVDLPALREWPSHFHPRALLVAARLAGADRPRRLNLLREAADAFERLGQPRGLRRCAREIARLERPAPAPAPQVPSPGGTDLTQEGSAAVTDSPAFWSDPPRWTLHLDRNGDRLMLGSLDAGPVDPPLSEQLGQGYATDAGTATALTALTATLREDLEIAPAALIAGLTTMPEGFARALGERLITHLRGWPLPPGPGLDLAIAAERLSAAALPWELLRLDPGRWQAARLRLLYRTPTGAQAGGRPFTAQGSRWAARWLQAGLRALGERSLAVDGVIGPRTQASLDTLLAAHDGDQARALSALRERLVATRETRPLAVILQAGEVLQRQSRRGLDYAGSQLPEVYRRAGFECQVVDGLDLDAWLLGEGRSSRPTVVHLYGTWVERRSTGYVGPDFGPDAGRGGAARKVGRARGGPVEIPLLILDGPAEPDPGEQMRQLMLRNAAGTLYARRAEFPNLLGLGLDPYPDLELMARLAAALIQGEPLRALYALLADQAAPPWSDLASALPVQTGRLTAALWTGNPDLSALRWDDP